METLSETDTHRAEEDATAAAAIRVCMHVLGPARTDVRVMREATALAQAGYAVAIVDVEGEGEQPVVEEFHGICLKHIIVSRSFLSTRFSRWSFIRATQILLRSTLRLIQTPADIYHAHDVSGLLPCYIAASLRRKPLIFDSHELPLGYMSIRSRWLLILLAHLLAYIVPRCAEVITVSSPIAQEMSKCYHIPKVSLIRNVPPYQAVPKSDRLRQHLGLSPNTRVALYQGGIQYNRSLDKLIHAAPFLDPDIVLVLMGPSEGSIGSELEALIASEGVSNRVKILPPVPYEELLDWTASADIGLIVFALDYSLSIRWCLPNKLFEYLMAGLPVLSSHLDAVVEVIKTYDVGCVVESLAPADIALSINAMLADSATLATMRRNALYAAHHEFVWEKEGQELVQLYRRILPTE